MHYFNRLSPAAIALLCSLMITSCKKDTTPKAFPAVQLKTDAELGSYLADSLGYTLYYFSNDFNGLNNCTGGCAAVWPVYYAGDLTQAKLGKDLDIADF